MKTKAYIKQGSYQRSSKKINGALDVNKEVLDTLVDKEVIGTTDCCNYFPTIPTIESLAGNFPPTSEQIAHVPVGGLFTITAEGDPNCFVIYIKSPNGEPASFFIGC